MLCRRRRVRRYGRTGARDAIETFGVEAATITTIHSLMNDQPVLDAYHHTDLRKTRAASQSIIPVDTGLAVDRADSACAGQTVCTCCACPPPRCRR